MTAEEYGVSFWGVRKRFKIDVATVALLHDYTKIPELAHLKRVSCITGELCPTVFTTKGKKTWEKNNMTGECLRA